MPLDIVKAVRKEFDVSAVRVTAANMEEAARWCRGKVRTEAAPNGGGTPGPGVRYIEVKVLHPINDKQKQARIDDWILITDTGVKVYSDKAFHNNFRVQKDEETHNVFEADAANSPVTASPIGAEVTEDI